MEAKIKGVGSTEPRPIAHGETACNSIGTQENIKVCPFKYLGCVSEEGGHCYNGVCDPIDEAGRHFTVRVTEAHGQKFTAKVYPEIMEVDDSQFRQTSSLSAADIEKLLKRQDELLPRTFTFRGMRITEEAL